MNIARLILSLLGLMNLGFAVWVLIDPTPTLNFIGITANTDAALSEINAIYGGLIGALGALSFAGVFFPSRTDAALWTNGCLFAGVGAVRTVSCLVWGLGGYQAFFSALEIVASVACFWALSRLPSADNKT